MDFLDRVRHRLWMLLAFSRIPGNAFSFWIRKTLHWSRGVPRLPHEPKTALFDYLAHPGEGEAAAEERERDLRSRYRLDDLHAASTRLLYRKNLYLIDLLEKACAGLPPLGSAPASTPSESMRAPVARAIKALDAGCQDWHYVFGLERWLRHGGWAGSDAAVSIRGVELDGYGIYGDFHSRRDYALAYARQTGNPGVEYSVGDFLRIGAGGRAGARAGKDAAADLDVVTFFYPFVTRYQLLLWGLPLRFFAPRGFVAQAASLLRPGGRLIVFAQSLAEHELFLGLGRASGAFELLREGAALSNLVDFHEEVEDRRYSIWEKLEERGKAGAT